jgi:hypothetical protein
MLKLNTVLTAVCAVLAAIAGYMGKCIWEDVATIKSLTTAQAVQMQSMQVTLNDHESRLRQAQADIFQNQKDILSLQIENKDARVARPPKLSDTTKP